MSEAEANARADEGDDAGGAGPPRAIARPVFMPETFTGIGREWSDWSEQFDLAADVNNWDEPLKLKFMSLLLSGRARDMYSGLSGDAKGNYALLKGAIARCFDTYAASTSNQGGSGYTGAKIGALDSLLLVDSGATLSVIPKQLWLEITKGGAELSGHQGDVSAANGGLMGILGKWQTVCQFDSLALIAEFLVADVPSQDILWGFDFLSKYGVVIDFGKKECRIMGKQFPLIVPADMDTPQTVSVLEDAVIPPLLVFVIVLVPFSD
uniref:Peptidase A2 domain-containing protein n=1 Tax=Gadus morhua TaxID=8049 RepID=A0A8C5BZ39_GADMO